MDTAQSYIEFISNIIATRGQFGIDSTEFFEQHHILPKCLGGKGDYSRGDFKQNSYNKNCIRLYPREHFIAHKLLALENPKNPKLVWAWQAMWMLDDAGIRYEPTPEEYELRKQVLHNCGLSPETLKKMSEANSGSKNGMYGKHHTAETREKLRQANLGKHLVWWNNGSKTTMSVDCPGEGWVRGRLSGFHDKKKRIITKPKIVPQYLWQLPDGSTAVMSKQNAAKWHPDWILISEVTKVEN